MRNPPARGGWLRKSGLQYTPSRPRGADSLLDSPDLQEASMRRSLSVGLPLVLAIVSSAFLFAQQPAQGQRAAGGTGGARASTAAASFKGEGVAAPGQNRPGAVLPGQAAHPDA